MIVEKTAVNNTYILILCNVLSKVKFALVSTVIPASVACRERNTNKETEGWKKLKLTKKGMKVRKTVKRNITDRVSLGTKSQNGAY